jgi:hypothetical protein
MANDFSLENISAYHTKYKCDMALAGRNLALKMRHTPLCNAEKIKFILAMIYLKTMIRKTEDSCITDEMICEYNNYIKKYLGSTHYATKGCGCS